LARGCGSRTYKEHSFLPHGIEGSTDPQLTPVLIGLADAPGEEEQVIINLSLAIPPFFGRFHRLCEPVDHEKTVREAARERFRYYRDRGYELHHHQIRL
jgi:DNA polymerase-3 subunit chi